MRCKPPIKGGSSSMAYTGAPLATKFSVISPCPAPISTQQEFSLPARAPPIECRETPISRAINSRVSKSAKKCCPSRCRAMQKSTPPVARDFVAAAFRGGRLFCPVAQPPSSTGTPACAAAPPTPRCGALAPAPTQKNARRSLSRGRPSGRPGFSSESASQPSTQNKKHRHSCLCRSTVRPQCVLCRGRLLERPDFFA